MAHAPTPLNPLQTVHSAFSPNSAGHLANSRRILELLTGPIHSREFGVRWWDGSTDHPGCEPRFTLLILRPGALRRMLLPPTELNLAEAFIQRDFDVEGSLELALSLEAAFRKARNVQTLTRLLSLLHTLPTNDLPAEAKVRRPSFKRSGFVHSPEQDARDVQAHYDLGNDFFGLFLDSGMNYSCAYFEYGSEDLETAQEKKLELICRKLRLLPGERLLNIGCGWGGLVLHAARQYGVRATGITLSEQQASLARARVRAAGLEEQVSIEVRDYRELNQQARFDKIVSVGMVEHVGRPNIHRYMIEAYRLLKPGGVFLCHGIIESRPTLPPLLRLWESLTWRRTSFLHHYIFPGGEVLYPSEMIQAAEAAGFETRDLENLREHYAMTVRAWWQRLESHQDEAILLVGEFTYRAYRLYLAAVIRTFERRVNGVCQYLFSRTLENGRCRMPTNRNDWYARPLGGGTG